MDDFRLILGDCLDVMRTLPDNSIDSVVTDPPYGIRFMGKAWDGADIDKKAAARRALASHAPGAGPNGGHKSLAAEAGKYNLSASSMLAFQEFSELWSREALRVLKPGGHLLSFSSPRTYHRMTCGIEDAGFEIRDCIQWVFGSGFPKSLDVSKTIDKSAGADREVLGERKKKQSFGAGANAVFGGGPDKNGVQLITAPTTEKAKQWQGWGTALKPAQEPICVARKPLIDTVAANVLEFGTGAINIDGCRVGAGAMMWESPRGGIWATDAEAKARLIDNPRGRWPANLIHDGLETEWARFFYCAKASQGDRDEGLIDFEPATTSDGRNKAADNAYQRGKTLRKNTHPTVKPTDLMRYLVRLVTPPGGVVLDPFMGSGSTGKACALEGFRFVGIDMLPEYVEIAGARIGAALLKDLL